ncbi:hypothetical protein PVAG01_01577 [Phlyctema vagabunda]|uniref:Uncharacterized protein n=1 Tax=Phlyctema vagabunda TaxID=108571 RepID=A0ABR4PXH0_9HELO
MNEARRGISDDKIADEVVAQVLRLRNRVIVDGSPDIEGAPALNAYYHTNDPRERKAILSNDRGQILEELFSNGVDITGIADEGELQYLRSHYDEEHIRALMSGIPVRADTPENPRDPRDPVAGLTEPEEDREITQADIERWKGQFRDQAEQHYAGNRWPPTWNPINAPRPDIAQNQEDSRSVRSESVDSSLPLAQVHMNTAQSTAQQPATTQYPQNPEAYTEERLPETQEELDQEVAALASGAGFTDVPSPRPGQPQQGAPNRQNLGANSEEEERLRALDENYYRAIAAIEAGTDVPGDPPLEPVFLDRRIDNIQPPQQDPFPTIPPSAPSQTDLARSSSGSAKKDPVAGKAKARRGTNIGRCTGRGKVYTPGGHIVRERGNETEDPTPNTTEAAIVVDSDRSDVGADKMPKKKGISNAVAHEIRRVQREEKKTKASIKRDGDPSNFWEGIGAQKLYDPDVLPGSASDIPKYRFLGDRALSLIMSDITAYTGDLRYKYWPGDFGAAGMPLAERKNVGNPAVTKKGKVMVCHNGYVLKGNLKGDGLWEIEKLRPASKLDSGRNARCVPNIQNMPDLAMISQPVDSKSDDSELADSQSESDESIAATPPKVAKSAKAIGKATDEVKTEKATPTAKSKEKRTSTNDIYEILSDSEESVKDSVNDKAIAQRNMAIAIAGDVVQAAVEAIRRTRDDESSKVLAGDIKALFDKIEKVAPNMRLAMLSRSKLVRKEFKKSLVFPEKATDIADDELIDYDPEERLFYNASAGPEAVKPKKRADTPVSRKSDRIASKRRAADSDEESNPPPKKRK